LLGKTAHVQQVAARKALHVGERRRQVFGKLVNNFGTPALCLLPLQNVAADVPVQQNQFAVDGQRGALLGGLDALLEIGKPKLRSSNLIPMRSVIVQATYPWQF
jgi:hypothetical protein